MMSAHQLIREAVLLTLIKGNDRIDRTGMVNALSQIISVSDIDSFGNLGNFSEWYILFKTTDARELVLKNNELKVNDQIFMISEPYKHIKIIRLLNVPPAVPDEDIKSIASKWGGSVLNVDVEKLPQPFETIKTFVRRIRIRFTSSQDEEKVPISIRYNGYTFSVHLEGRQKVCFRCKQAGHIKAECSALKCQKCNGIGHDDPSCQQKRLYATVVISTPADDGHLRPPVNRPNVGDKVTPGDPTVNSLSVLPKRLPYCHKCKQQGHKKKDCPQHTNLSSKVLNNVGGGQSNASGDMNQSTPTGYTSGSSDIDSAFPVVTREESRFESPRLMMDNEGGDVIASVTMNDVALNNFNQNLLNEAFKNADKELKRTNADRSIDSEIDKNHKKSHICNSSTPTPGETESEEDSDEEGGEDDVDIENISLFSYYYIVNII
jgi:hypothetical protein